MVEEKNEFALLKNRAARVIYYSCIVEPKTIPELADLWEYKTSAYFYQRATKELIRNMEDEGLITFVRGKGGGISSNYDVVVNKVRAESFFGRLNDDISDFLIVWATDYEVEPKELENRKYKEYLINEIEGLRAALTEMMFTSKDVKQIVSLWEDTLFKEIFLSADFIKSLFKSHYAVAGGLLPQDPREFLYRLIVTLCEDTWIDPLHHEGEDDYLGQVDFQVLNPYGRIHIDDERYWDLNFKIERMRKSAQTVKLTRVTTKIKEISKILFRKHEAFPWELVDKVEPKEEFIRQMGFRAK